MSTNDAPATPDPDALKLFSLRVWTYKMGEVVSLMIHLGDRLGVYQAMDGAGPITSQWLAEITDLDERLLHEWLMGQAAAGLLERDDSGTFELSAEGAAVLAAEHNSIDFAGGAFQGGVEPNVIDALAESFRSGIGITYEQQGSTAAAGLARMTAPRSRQSLISKVVPAVEGLHEALTDGIKVVEVGCGGGVVLTLLAEAYPRSTFIGIDPSPTATALAGERARTTGLHNVAFVEGFAVDIERDGDAGLVMAFDCLHDMPRPDLATAAIEQAMADDGVFLVKEIRSSGSFERDSRNPLLPLLYGFSVSSCLQSAMSEPDGFGLGTVGLHPQRLTELMTTNGFSSVVKHDLEDPQNLYYEVRK